MIPGIHIGEPTWFALDKLCNQANGTYSVMMATEEGTMTRGLLNPTVTIDTPVENSKGYLKQVAFYVLDIGISSSAVAGSSNRGLVPTDIVFLCK